MANQISIKNYSKIDYSNHSGDLELDSNFCILKTRGNSYVNMVFSNIDRIVITEGLLKHLEKRFLDKDLTDYFNILCFLTSYQFYYERNVCNHTSLSVFTGIFNGFIRKFYSVNNETFNLDEYYLKFFNDLDYNIDNNLIKMDKNKVRFNYLIKVLTNNINLKIIENIPPHLNNYNQIIKNNQLFIKLWNSLCKIDKSQTKQTYGFFSSGIFKIIQDKMIRSNIIENKLGNYNTYQIFELAQSYKTITKLNMFQQTVIISSFFSLPPESQLLILNIINIIDLKKINHIIFPKLYQLDEKVQIMYLSRLTKDIIIDYYITSEEVKSSNDKNISLYFYKLYFENLSPTQIKNICSLIDLSSKLEDEYCFDIDNATVMLLFMGFPKNKSMNLNLNVSIERLCKILFLKLSNKNFNNPQPLIDEYMINNLFINKYKKRIQTYILENDFKIVAKTEDRINEIFDNAKMPFKFYIQAPLSLKYLCLNTIDFSDEEQLNHLKDLFIKQTINDKDDTVNLFDNNSNYNQIYQRLQSYGKISEIEFFILLIKRMNEHIFLIRKNKQSIYNDYKNKFVLTDENISRILEATDGYILNYECLAYLASDYNSVVKYYTKAIDRFFTDINHNIKSYHNYKDTIDKNIEWLPYEIRQEVNFDNRLFSTIEKNKDYESIFLLSSLFSKHKNYYSLLDIF